MDTTIREDRILPAYLALKLPTRKLKRHYIKLHKALMKAGTFTPRRFVHTPTRIGNEVNFLMSDIEEVRNELTARGVLTVHPQGVHTYFSELHTKALAKLG